MAKLPMNLLVSERICGALVTTRNTAMLPIMPITLIELYDILQIFGTNGRVNEREWANFRPLPKRPTESTGRSAEMRTVPHSRRARAPTLGREGDARRHNGMLCSTHIKKIDVVRL